MSRDLTPEKALIFRIVHRDNLAWISQHGLHCQNSERRDPHYINIGNPELIERRRHRIVPRAPGGTLSDYIPFYFTPFSPMLYNIKTGHGGIQKRSNEEIAILVSSLHKLQEKKMSFLFTDRHAYLRPAEFYSDLSNLTQIDWAILQRRDFQHDHEDLGKFERYQAEALVHKYLPIEALLGIVCYSDSVASNLDGNLTRRGLSIKIAVKPDWYFR